MAKKTPGCLQCVGFSSNCVTMEWIQPKYDKREIQYYELRYREKDTKKWTPVSTPDNLTLYDVKGLRSSTSYDFKVRAIFYDTENEDEEEGPFSEICGNITTKESLSDQIIPYATKVQDGVPTIYKLPLTETYVHDELKTRKCIFKNPHVALAVLEKTIMVLGATGSGKSTLIDGMVNFLLAVTWEEKCRFTIIDLKGQEVTNLKVKSQSQTEWITCYIIESNIGQQIKLNIIDTPGFGDTRGIVRDKELVKQIKHFFSAPLPDGILCLDAVCFVVQASLIRLTAQQQYVFDSVLSLFGNNISENIFILITFADGDVPPVKSALETANIPVEKLFKFNNSALFVSTQNSDKEPFGKMFWDMGKDSFNAFFMHLLSTEPISLQLTNEVLQLREDLEYTIQGLMPQITEGLHMISRIKGEKKIINEHKKDIEESKNFEVDNVVDSHRRVDLKVGEYVTNCLNCNRSCHYPCYIPKTEDKRGCWAMDSTGNCKICPLKCIWSSHCNSEYRFEPCTKIERVTLQGVKDRYLSACSNETMHSNMLKNLKDQLRDIHKRVLSLINDARKCINELNQKALKFNPLSQVEYIELLIQAEEAEPNPGWENRVKELRTFKEKAKLMDNVHDQEFQPWIDGEASNLLQELNIS